VDLIALAQDGAGAQEADACDHLSGDARRVGARAENFKPQPREQARANADETECLDACGMAVELALETDRDRKDRGDEQAQGEVGVASEWQLG
jgi:hypothetical protein